MNNIGEYKNKALKSYKILDRRYGKSFVKLLHLERRGNVHTVKEYEVNTFLTLATDIDFVDGNNENIVATDSQKNIVYLTAKQYGIECPEKFATLLVSHFLKKYAGNVIEATVEVEEPIVWERMHGNHVHAFMADTSIIRFCRVSQKAQEPNPHISTGLKNFRILKSTKSAFTNFVDDEYRTLPFTDDRIFSTIVESEWDYNPSLALSPQEYDEIFKKVVDIIIDRFAGDPTHGIESPSVQQTMYMCQCAILSRIASIAKIFMKMPNKHYFSIDLSRFSKSVGGCQKNEDVFLPVDKPSGMIECTVERDDL